LQTQSEAFGRRQRTRRRFIDEHNRMMMKKWGRRTFRGRNRIQRTVSDKSERTLNSNSTNYEELDILISKYKGQKLTNEQVAEVVSAACFVSNNQKILLKENLKITDDLKEICNQFKVAERQKKERDFRWILHRW
jgi:hypothetical protein